MAHVFPAARLASALFLLSSFPIKLSPRHFVLHCNSKLLRPQSPFGSSLLPLHRLRLKKVEFLMIISRIKLFCSHHHKWWDLKKSCLSHLIHTPPSPQRIFIFPLHHLEGSTTIGKSVGISSWKLGDLPLNLHISCIQIFMYFLTFSEFPAPRFCSKVDSRPICLCVVT